VILLLLIVAMALGLRLYGLGEFPPGCHVDEAENGLLAQRVLKGGWFPVYTEVGNGKATLHFYLIALAFRLLGVSTWSIRVVSAVVGGLTVIPLFLLARAAFGPGAGLASAFVLAVSRWHITFSRIGYDAVLAIFFAVLLFLFLFLALETGKRRYFLLGGATLGLGLYTYIAFRLIPVIVVGVLLREAAVEWRRLRRYVPALVNGTVVALIIFAPLGLYAAFHWDIFMFRINQVYLGTHAPGESFAPALFGNMKATALMFNVRGDANGRHNLPDAPMLDDVSAALLLLGFVLLLREARARAAFLVLLWFGVMVLPGILSIEAPQALRNSGTIPAISISVGLFAARFAHFMGRGRRVAGMIAGATVTAGILLGIAAMNVDAYFRRQAASPRVWGSFDVRETAMGRHIAESAGRAAVFLDAPYSGYPVITFEAGEEAEYLPFRLGDLPLPDDVTSIALEDEYLFLLAPVPTYLTLLQAYYPEGSGEEYEDRFGEPLYFAFTVSREAVLRSRGLVATCTPYAGGAEGVRRARVVGLEMPPGLAPGRAYSGRWEGSVVIRDDGPYAFGARSSVPLVLTVGGEEVYRSRGSSGRVEVGKVVMLARGTYPLVAESRRIGADDTIELVWRKADGEAVPVPKEHLFVQTLGRGLLGTYWQHGTWDGDDPGEPAFMRLDPEIYFYWHIPPFREGGPFRVEWRGELEAEEPGTYLLEIQAIDYGEVWIDGRSAIRSGEHTGKIEECSLELAAGRHAFRARHASMGRYPTMRLWWTPPGGSRSVIPWTVFSPPPSAPAG
jgi:4-amino-4-deoxy-L-arabinose transferase-like glycosyltransferase